MLKVAKFGGSSVASVEQFKKVKEIVKMDSSRKFVVVSAVGKAGKDDNKNNRFIVSLLCTYKI